MKKPILITLIEREKEKSFNELFALSLALKYLKK